MKYEIAKRLKEAGFRYDRVQDDAPAIGDMTAEREPVCRPSLERLIAACEGPVVLICTAEKTMAIQGEHVVTGDTPTEAAALLWLVQHADPNGCPLQ
jgi:hypothetical protein